MFPGLGGTTARESWLRRVTGVLQTNLSLLVCR